MSREHDILDDTIQHQVLLERVGSDVSRRVRKRVAKLVPVTIEAMLGFDDVAELETDELQDLLREAQVKQTQVMVDALAEMTGQLESLSGDEAAWHGKALKAWTRGATIKVMKAAEAYQAALEAPIAATGDLLEDFTDGWSKSQVKAVNAAISRGYTQGQTTADIVRAIRGTKAKRYADGIMESVGRNTDAVVRTAIQHVASTARMETWARNADVVEGYKIVATLDGKTTPICRSLDGQVFPLGKGPKPPFHIRCRTTTAPEIAKEFAWLSEGETRSSAKGPVDADLTYYGWLKTQPAKFQDLAIGPARAQLLRDGGLTADEFARLNLGRNFEPLTLDEMRKIEPGAFRRAGL